MSLETRTHKDQFESSHLIMRGLMDTHGIDHQTARDGLHWAHLWHGELTRLPEETPITDEIIANTRVASLDGMDINRDINGRPRFRTSYAAERALIAMGGDRSEQIRHLVDSPGIIPIPHFNRLESLLGTLLPIYRDDEFPYYLNRARLPQDVRHMPPEANLPRGSTEHARFLFYSNHFMRGNIRSVDAFKRLSRVYLDHPEVFDPWYASDMDKNELRQILADNWLGRDGTKIPGNWIENSRRLVEQFDGDPWKIIEGETDYEQILDKVANKNGRGFIGFQEKMTSMLIYYLVDARPELYFDFPLPTDFHVLRVSAANEVITFENVPEDGNIVSPQTLTMLREMYHDYSLQYGVSQIDIANAVWLYSSALCSRQPGNKATEKGGYARKTIIESATIDYIANPKQLAVFNRTCGQCALRGTCTSNIPSKPYYRTGIARLTPRIEPDPNFTDPLLIEQTGHGTRALPVIPGSDVLCPLSERSRIQAIPDQGRLF